MKLPGFEIDFDALGGRAFILAVGCSAVNTVLKWFDHLDNPSYTLIISATVGAYIAANAVEKHAQTKADTAVAVANIAAGNTGPAPLGSS